MDVSLIIEDVSENNAMPDESLDCGMKLHFSLPFVKSVDQTLPEITHES